MKLTLFAFTGAGDMLSEELVPLLAKSAHEVIAVHLLRSNGDVVQQTSLLELTARAWRSGDGLIFIGATGIAVRAIAPFVRDKLTDPAVISMDERGQFVVSLLSGHVGGANSLAREIAALLGSTPVISTATDLNDCYAVDLWAMEHGYVLLERGLVKIVSAALLAGKKVCFQSDMLPVRPPNGLYVADEGELGVFLSYRIRSPFDLTLHVFPRGIILGIGCRCGVSNVDFEQVIWFVLSQYRLAPQSVSALATIDLKRNEPCILAFCEKYHLPITFHPAAVLRDVSGHYTASAFVRGITGVDNVCERAAVFAACGAPLIFRKTTYNGVTVAGAWRLADKP